MNTIYISGPMTGYVDHNFPAFMAAEKIWVAAGWQVENPAHNPIDEQFSWTDYMKLDLMRLARSNAIALLPKWERSKGATLETLIAVELGYPTYDAYSMEPINVADPLRAITFARCYQELGNLVGVD